MKTNHRRNGAARRDSAFTLVELLVVIAVIAILVGIVSALLGGMGEQSQNSKARDLCAQVADSWTILAVTQGRLPSAELVSSVVDTKPLDGDISFPMTPAAGCLINDWTKHSPIPAADKNFYEARIEKGALGDYDDVIEWTTDTIFERTPLQKRIGVYAPWVERELREELDAGFEQKATTDEIKTALDGIKGEFGDGIVWVALDSNGDGKIKIPKNEAGTADDLELHATAVAWVWNKNRTKSIHSW